MNRTYPIIGKPRHYAWGGESYIPTLIGIENQQKQCFAEWWLGTHPDEPSMIEVDGEIHSLLDWLRDHPQMQSPAERQGEYPLPFLMKVLDVNQMLAIQVHPTKLQAEEGFIRQDQLGISRNAPERTYRDRNDKPEMMVALTPSWLAHGFAIKAKIIERFTAYDSFVDACDLLRLFGIRTAFEHLMAAPQSEIDDIIVEVVTKHRAAYQAKQLDESLAEYWVCQSVLGHDSGNDRGLVALMMMNIVHVPVGHGIYQDAGIPHAYLSGQNVELMSNSDNVVRIGPTKLHVDLNEVHRLIDYAEVTPKVLVPESEGDTVACQNYLHNGSHDFALRRLSLSDDVNATSYNHQHLSIALVMSGSIQVNADNYSKTYTKGETFVIPAKHHLKLYSAQCTVYIASYGAI
ncbi:mannose-6-phosphate isomerase, class I [Thaumasiovibrio sp. DFM-14]|uniref:mannose-6-phosphate isomerase, class I n=1 Tax=Thaumasiovibrio sp. DFM-14 TaxID=3384792 RepID=UPI0039A3BAA0